MRYGLIGQSLQHSFSPEIHARLGQYDYELRQLAPEELAPFLRAREFAGVNVTIPYKQTVIPLLDELTDRARAIGAVNTVVNRNGRLIGDNTDFGGLSMLIRRMGVDLRGKTVLIAGTGGTSRTAQAVVRALGADRIFRISRTGREEALTYGEAYALEAEAPFLINTTPVGMYPDADGVPLELDRLPTAAGVADVIYNPLTTRLVRQARARGIPAENGLYMLVAQAALASRAFTGSPVTREVIDRVYEQLLRDKRAIVLTGMPGSGKSTLGRLLAGRLGRPLIDTDEEIVRRAGIPIPRIFRDRGETYFRDLETRVIRDVSRTGGGILSVGGGAVLRQENVDALKQNGTLVFLDRAVEALTPTADRPLSDSADKLRALYERRLPLYTAAADLILPVRGTPEETADKLLEMMQL